MNKINLLLLDTRILDLNDIINSIQTNTKYILVDYYNDTFNTLINKINNLNFDSIESIGLLRHGYYLQYYKFLDKQLVPSIVQNIELIDPELSTWYEFISFIDSFNISRFDFISCRLDLYPEYNYIFNKLKQILDINICASTNNIGHLTNITTNWNLNYGNINLLDVYFTENILNYQYLFFQPVLSIKPNFIVKNYDNQYFINPSATYDGFIDNDNNLSLSGVIYFYGPYTTAKNVGIYPILVNGLLSNKYYLDFQEGSLVILPSILNIFIDNLIKIYDGLTDIPNYTVNYIGFQNENYSCLSGK